MILRHFNSLVQLLDEDPFVEVAYEYTDNGKTLYAVFAAGDDDEVHLTPGVGPYYVLYYRGRWTTRGKRLLREASQCQLLL